MRAGQMCDVDAVVDDQQRPCVAAGARECASERERERVAGALGPKLEDGRAFGEDGVGDSQRAVALVLGAHVDDRVDAFDHDSPFEPLGTSMSSSRMRAWSVLRLRPNRRAARSLLPPVFSNARRISGRSTAAST